MTMNLLFELLLFSIAVVSSTSSRSNTAFIFRDASLHQAEQQPATTLKDKVRALSPSSKILSSLSSQSETSSSEDDVEKRIVNSCIPETSPLPPHTFAGMVEGGLIDRFTNKAKDVDRILESWRLLEKGYEHFEYVGDGNKDPFDSDCHQQCHSYVRGLTCQEFWEDHERDAPWAKQLEKKYRMIYDEFVRVTADMDQLRQDGNNIWSGALTEDASAYGRGWKTLVLMDRGVWDPINVNLFPKTAQAIRDCNVPAVEVFFTNLQPNSDIKKHSDLTNFVLTSHLALDIPDNGQNKCRLTIGDTTKQWLNGQVLLFDTSILHDACNESNRDRYLLMMRVWHPHLSQDERDALQYTYDALMVPDLVSSDPAQRLVAEQQVKQMHEFPKIKRGGSAASIQGFGQSAAGVGGSTPTKKNKKKKNRRK